MRWKGLPLEVAPLLFFDVETSGLRPDRGATIVELALIDVQKPLLLWQGTRTQRMARAQFMALFAHFRTGVVVGHNLRFDFWFVTHEAGKLGLAMPPVRFIDTLGLARRLLPEQTDYRLDALLQALGIESPEALHTAAADARATRALFWKLVARGKLRTLSDAGMQQLTWAHH